MKIQIQVKYNNECYKSDITEIDENIKSLEDVAETIRYSENLYITDADGDCVVFPEQTYKNSVIIIKKIDE